MASTYLAGLVRLIVVPRLIRRLILAIVLALVAYLVSRVYREDSLYQILLMFSLLPLIQGFQNIELMIYRQKTIFAGSSGSSWQLRVELLRLFSSLDVRMKAST